MGNTFQDDGHYQGAGDGTAAATWTFSNLTPGQYRIATTWQPDFNRATNAPYTVLDGTTALATTLVNQRLTPGDFNDAGASWRELGVYTITGNSLSVRLTDQVDGFVIADAALIERIEGPRVQVRDGAVNLADDTGKADFGVAAIGQPLVKTFTVRNAGTADLHLTGPIVVPTGFTLESGFGATTLAPGASTTFAIRYDAAAGAASGQVSFGTDDPALGQFHFNIAGAASRGRIIDDGEVGTPGFAMSGNWWPFSLSTAFGGDGQYKSKSMGDGTATATWTFDGLSPGRYRVATTWLPAPDRATNTPYTIRDGATALGTVAVDQRLAPDDFTDAGASWHNLGVFTLNGNTLTVQLSDLADGYVIADAIFLEREPGPQVQVLDGTTGLTDGTAKVDYGVVAIGQSQVKTFTVRNAGTTDLHLTGPIEVPAGFSLVAGFGATTLAPGASTTFAVRYDAAAGAAWGQVTFDTDDAILGRFAFQVTGAASRGRIIDDGDLGFTSSGSWTFFSYPQQGFNEDYFYRLASPSDGSSTATWTFDNLTPGRYLVAVTWAAHDNRATNAPFSVLTGSTVLGTMAVNQRQAPNDFTDAGALWHELGVYTVSGDSLSVRLNDLANGYVIADAVFLRRIEGARAEVLDGTTRVADAMGRTEFGVVPIDQPSVKIFTVRNTGTEDLHLTGPIEVPAGFSLVAGFGATTLAPGASTTFALRYDATAGAASGQVAFDTDDPDQGRYEFTVAGWASRGRIIDDGEEGFATTGSWWPLYYPSSRFKGDFRFGNAPVPDGSSTATWTFDNLTPGQYLVAITWETATDRATNAPFTVLDGTTVLGTTAVNQLLAPGDFTDAGTSWRTLGIYTITGNSLSVRLNDLADGLVIADAVFIQRVEPAPTQGLDLSMVPQLPANARTGTGVRSLASFRFTTGTVADYTASISWGDGSTTVGTIVAGPGGTGFVLGGHTYLDSGSDTVSVTVSGHGTSATVYTAIQVNPFGSSGSGGPEYGPWPEPSGEVAFKGLVLAPIQGQAELTTLALIVGASSSTASDFSGTVDWGDGTTSNVTVVASPTGDGQFLVTGSHAYAWTGTFTTVVTITGNGAVYTAYGKSLVASPNFTATPTTMTGSVGQVWSGVVATVTAAGPDVGAGNLLATIDWGDGHVTPGLVVARSASVFDVVGVNVYGTAGAFPVTVHLSDLEGATIAAGGVATIAGMPLSGFGQPLSLVAGASFTGLVATLVNPNPGAQASQMTATIDWGDGTTTTGSVVADSTDGKFHITGSKTYAKPGTYSVTVQISDQLGSQATAIADAVVVGAAVTATGRNASAVEGSPFNGVVASFTVPNASASASDFTATIWWGDGFASTGTITGSGGQFEVSGTHGYSTYGAYAIGIQISDGSNGVVAQGKITVTGAGLTVTGRPVAAVEGSPFNGVVATFVDANPGSSAPQFKAVITWGDGQQSLGTIQADPAGGGLYSVVGSHLYGTTGSYPVTVQVSDVGGGSGSASGTANVAVSALAVAPPLLSAAANQAFSGAVTTFTKVGAYTAADFTATINWGDGTSSPGTISSSGAAGEFIVSGSHTYPSIGSYTVTATVTLTPGSGGSTSASGTASVSNTAASAGSIVATAGTAWSGTAATFSTTDLGLTTASFTATIEWGDGASTAGVVSSTGTAGQFTVTGTHTYATAGAFAAVVRITDPAGRVAATNATVIVTDPALSVTAVAPAATEGVLFSGDVAMFTTAGARAASDFGATIRWGDGSTSVGVVAPTGTPGQYKVTGTHVYEQRGSYPVTVQVISKGGSSGENSTTATVARAPFTVQAVAVSARTGGPFSGLVATFTSAPARLANEFTATIDWGDGTSSAGTVLAPAPGTGTFQIKAMHT